MIWSFNLLDSIPVIGHVKGIIQIVAGDANAGQNAFAAANRSTAVMAAGAVGAAIGGPVGMVSGAIAAGSACDGLASLATQRPHGVFEGLRDIGNDISHGCIPFKSTIKTGLFIGADVLSGIGGGDLPKMSAKMGEELFKDVFIISVKNATKKTCILAVSGGVTRKAAGDIKPNFYYYDNRRKKSKSSSGAGSVPSDRKRGKNAEDGTDVCDSTSPTGRNSAHRRHISRYSEGFTGAGDGSDPPDRRRNKKTDHETDMGFQKESHFDVLLRLFKVAKLEDILLGGVPIFKEITSGLPTDRARKNSLKKLIQALRDGGMIERVIEAVKNIFSKLDRSDISFQNFLIVCEMVATYAGERLARRHEVQTSSCRLVTPFHLRRADNLAELWKDFFDPGSAHNILNILRELRVRVEEISKNVTPNFDNSLSATYHYFKHKFVPASSEVLSIPEYFNLFASMMPRIRQSPQYAELKNPSHPRRRLVYDRYYEKFKRRVRIVLKIQDNLPPNLQQIVISTCHILDVIYDGDYDGYSEYDQN